MRLENVTPRSENGVNRLVIQRSPAIVVRYTGSNSTAVRKDLVPRGRIEGPPAFDIAMKKAQLALAVVVLFALATVSFGGESGVRPAPLTKVESKNVCMINERSMGKPQIPIVVDGKTYYGCCDMCKKALATDASKRVAKDPVSGAQVDKAAAVIAANADGAVFYFQNAKNLDTYNARLAKSEKK